MKDILTIVIAGVVLFIIDIVTSPPGYYNCLDPTTGTAILLHHIINVYSQFGFLCSGFLLYGYLVTPLIVLLHWKTNNNKCILTEYVNDKCGFPNTEYFRDMWYLVGLKRLKNYDTLHKTYLVAAWLVALVRVIVFKPVFLSLH